MSKRKDPHVELQEPGVSHFATPEEDMFLTLPSLPPTITPEAARTQRSLAVHRDTGHPRTTTRRGLGAAAT